MNARAGSIVGLGAGGPPNTLTGALGTDATVHARGGMDSVAQLIPGLSARMNSAVGTFLQGVEGATSIVTPKGSGMRHVDRPTEASYDVNIKLMMKGLRNDAQQTYGVGTHMFLHQSELDVSDEKNMALSLPVLNDMLERAKRQEQLHKASIGTAQAVLSGRKRGADSEFDFDGDGGANDPNLLVAHFPLTIEEFQRDISYIGPILTMHTTLPAIELLTAQKIVGRQRTCKLWRDLSQGDGLGWNIKQHDNLYSFQYDYRGQPVDSATPGPFLQVRPVALRESRSPILCSDYLNPDEDDLYCFEQTTVRRKILQELPGAPGLLDFESPASVEETPLVLDQLREGIFIPCGTVFINDRPDPTDEEIDMALRSQAAYDELASRCSLDILYDVGAGLNHTLFPGTTASV